MKPNLAVVVLAALAPCLLTIERITAAPPEAACEACCEKPCCAEKPCDGEKACCSEKPCSDNSTAATECGNGDCNLSTALDGVGLKLFWTLPLTTSQPAALSSTALPKPCPSSPCANSACAGSLSTAPAFGSAADSSTSPCSEASRVHYAAIPAAVPSPFAKGGENLSAPVLATQAYAATLPLQAPPAPVSQASANLAAPNPVPCPTCGAAVVAPQPVPCPTCVAPAAKLRRQPEATQVLFSVDVIEDSSNSLAEFESLQSAMPFLTAESEIILSTMRILEKQNLLRRLSNPRLVTTVGRPAILQVGTETPGENGDAAIFSGLRMEVAARELGGGLEIEFKFCDTTGSQRCEVATSLLLAHGQTVVMKTSHPNRKSAEAENGDDERPVYVVLTPQVLK